MRKRTITLSLSCLALLLGANSATAAILGLHNTGEAGIGVADAYYNGPPTNAYDPTGSGPLTSATAYGALPHTTYVSTGLAPGSNWITFAVDGYNLPLSVAAGFYSYHYTTPDWSAYTNIAIEFDMASDNSVRVYLNGDSTPVAQLIAAGAADESTFTSLHHFVINTGFISGVNHLLFQVENIENIGYNPESLLITNMAESATEQVTAPVPEPATCVAWSAWGGLGLLLGARRRMSKRVNAAA